MPDGWVSVRLHSIAALESGGTPSKNRADWWTGPIPWASPKDMKKSRLSDTRDHISEEGLRNGSRLAPVKSIFVVVRGMILAKDLPVALAEVPMAFNQDMKALITRPVVDPEYLLYALTAQRDALAKAISTSAHGTRRMETASLESLLLPLPSKDEQRRIAGVLAKLEAAVEVQDRAVRSLRELKTATMAKLFREGLRGEPLKQTEIGEIPRSWDVVQLGTIGKIGNGSTPKRDNPRYWEGGTIPWLTSGKVHEALIETADEFISPLARA
ncbi:MAG: restriction endonuclease subunit S, partial [Thermoanaerobaculia bacterium]